MLTTLFHIVIGIFLVLIAWKLLKSLLKVMIWLIPLLLLTAFFFPGALALVGGFGFLLITVLGTLLILTIFSFFFFEGE